MNKDQAINIVLKHLSYRDCSDNTLKMYDFYLTKFFEYLKVDDVTTITSDDCMDYIIHLKNNSKLKNASLNVQIAAFRYFFDVVLNSSLSKRQLPSLLVDDVPLFIFSNEEINNLLNNASIKQKAMIALGFDCGLRVSEVAKLKVADIDSVNMLLTIHQSKRRKTRKVKLSSFCLTLLREYWLDAKPTNGYMFPSANNKTYMNPKSINNSFKPLFRRCDCSNNVRFHNFRHTYATHLLNNDCNIFLLKKLLGHKSFASTARYIYSGDKDIQLAPSVSSIWGLENINE